MHTRTKKSDPQKIRELEPRERSVSYALLSIGPCLGLSWIRSKNNGIELPLKIEQPRKANIMTVYTHEDTIVPSPEDFHVHADISERIVIKPEDYSWEPSAVPGVQQMVLDRIVSEMAHSTTIMRYTTGSECAAWVQHGDEEVFVLDGTFTDEDGEYSTGAYVRNPKGTASTRRVAANGSTLFMKSHPFAKNDKQRTVIDTKKATWRPGVAEGLQVMPLHEYEGEHVALVRWAPHTQFNLHSHRGGEEILVLEGVFYDEYDCYPTGTWIRSPHLSHHTPFTREEGALIYVKVGHLVAPNL